MMKMLWLKLKSIAVLEEGSHFRAVNDVTGKPFGTRDGDKKWAGYSCRKNNFQRNRKICLVRRKVQSLSFLANSMLLRT